MSKAAKLIREARQAAGLTQLDLATRLGVTQPTVAALERASSNPRLATLERVLRAAGSELSATSRPLPPIDETQIRERLRLSPAERLRVFERSQAQLTRLVHGARRV